MTIPPISLGLIKGAEWLKALNAEMFLFGQSHGYMNKNAEHTSVHALAGRLQAGPNGNLELTVPSSLIKGVFDALDEPGAEFVVRNNRTECAIKVMTKEEVDKLGGTSHITERGHSYHYTLGPIVELPATGEYEKLWAISIKSDDLESIRRSYGLETSPQLGFYIPVGCKKKKVTDDNKVSKLAGSAEDPMHLYSYIPSGAIKHVKEHGLLSGNELAKPENRHLLDIARPNGDADRWLKEREEKLIKSPWANTYNGPSVLFGGIDTDKINDMHPIKKFNTTRAKINLHELLKDYPATKLEGSELIPFSDEAYDAMDEKGQNEFVNKRHHTLSPEEIKSLIARGQNPKDMWKDFKDTEGKYYASDVPHAKVVTPMGKIPSKYIEFDEELPVSKLASLLNPWHKKVQHFIGQGYTPIAAPDGNVTFKKGDKYYSWAHDAMDGQLKEVSPADAAADLEYSGSWNEPELSSVSKLAGVFYHGSPKGDLQSLYKGSYVTPDLETAKIMARFHEATGKPWTDDDLEEPYEFGTPQPKWKAGREPKGEPAIYRLIAATKKLNLLDNPWEHTTLEELPVSKLAGLLKQSVYWSKDVSRDLLNGRKYPLSYLTGELGELGESVKNMDWPNFKEELGDSAYAAQMILAQKLGLNLPLIGASAPVDKFYARRKGWEDIFKDRGVTFSNDYLAGGSNLKKPKKIQAALGLAGHAITKDEARAFALKHGGGIEDDWTDA